MGISPTPPDIYQLMYRHSSAIINVRNVDHIVVEDNNGKSDISCYPYHPYIHQDPKP